MYWAPSYVAGVSVKLTSSEFVLANFGAQTIHIVGSERVHGLRLAESDHVGRIEPNISCFPGSGLENAYAPEWRKRASAPDFLGARRRAVHCFQKILPNHPRESAKSMLKNFSFR